MRKTVCIRVFTIAVLSVVVGLLGSLAYAAEVPAEQQPSQEAVSNGNKPADDRDKKPDSDSPVKGEDKKPGDSPPTSKAAQAVDPQPPKSSLRTEALVNESNAAAALLGRLNPEHLQSLGQMLDDDWKDRPEWGEMAVAIMKGDFMRPNVGWWKPGLKRYDWKWLREKYDANKDNTIDRAEFPAEISHADKLFDRLDRERDGQLKAADFDFTDSLAGNMAAMMGMNMSTMKNMLSNQLFSRLDKDSNGRITFEEITDFYLFADSEDLGFLTPEDLRFAIDDPPQPPPDSKSAEARPPAGPSTTSDAMRMFLNHELGWMGAGPTLGDPAPAFSLPTHDHKSVVNIADSIGKKPIILIFGSFT